MSNGFTELGISPPILKAIDEMGFTEPTEVQSRAIPHILKKEDLIVMSKTGSGKTAVFGVSMLQLTDPAASGPQGLILTPTRELAVQVDNDLKLLAKHLTHKTTVVFGQHSMNVEIRELKAGPTIVTGTPGRVFDHIRHGNLVTKHIRFLVLDEADRMLDMGFLEQVVRIIRTIPRDRVTLLFSATIPPEVRRICSEYMKNPEMIEIESQTKTVDAIEQVYYRVAHNEKNTQLNRLLLVEQPESCMIFCNTRMGVDRVQTFLTRKGYASQALHGDIPQGKRLKTIEQFKQGEFHLLVATDVAARGIHIDNLSLVINYDVPVEKDSYVHRIGRTGRAGNVGRSITLVTGEDIMSLYAIEEHIGAMIEEGELPSENLFNERKAAAGSWLEANALKSPPPGESAGQNEKGARKRNPSEPGRSRRNDRNKRPSDGARNAENKKNNENRIESDRPEKGESAQKGPRRPDGGQNNERRRPDGGQADNRRRPDGDQADNRRRPDAGQADNRRRPDGSQADNRRRPDGSQADNRRRPDGGQNGERPNGSRPPYPGRQGGGSNPRNQGERTDGIRTPDQGRHTGYSRTPYQSEGSRQLGTPSTAGRSTGTGTNQTGTPPVPSAGKEPASRKPFLQRILNRILGK